MRISYLLHVAVLLAAILFLPVQTSAQQGRLTNLPAIYIDTYEGKRVVSTTNYIWASLRYIDEDDQVTVYDSVEIRGRGNSTWKMEKKPYKLKFPAKQKFLGKGYAKAKKWTLLANAGDKSLIRNAVTRSLGLFCASRPWSEGQVSLPFTPACKFVDLTLNGAYMGNYQISDQVDVRPHRVDITEQDYPITLTSDITGGYLLEVDGFADGNSFYTSNYNVPIRIHYPDEDEIAGAQNTYIRNYFRKFESSLSSDDFADATKGYRSLVDSASLADWYICTEVSANIDGFYSIYLYKEQQDNRLFWGPLWDYDIAYNNDWRIWKEENLQTTVNSMMADIGYGTARKWFARMWEDPWFSRLVCRRYEQLQNDGLVQHLHHAIDSLQVLLQESQQLNYERWGIQTRMYHELVLYSSYEEYVDDLRQFITERCAWLAQQFAERKPEEPTPPVPEHDGIDTSEPDAYALAYDALTGRLHFGADNRSQLHFMVSIHHADGRLIGRFMAAESFSMATCPQGIYIVSWTVGGRQRSVKFVKR